MCRMMNLAFLFLINIAPAASGASDIVYPTDANIINVTNPPSGFSAAVPDDGQDDTAAINALLAAYNGQTNGNIHALASRVFYFPAGVYNLTNTLAARIDGQTASSVAFSGAGMGRTVFKLQSGADGFGSTNSPKPVIMLGKQYVAGDPRVTGPDSAYGNLVRNLSVELGDNPGAVGVFVTLANMGQVHDVSVSATNAFAGLVTYDRSSPGLIRNVFIEDCDYGIYQMWDYREETYMQFPGDSQTDGLVFEHITVSGYRRSGIYNCAKHYILRDVVLSSTNASGPAVYLGFDGHPAQFEALDLVVEGTSGQPGVQTAHDDVFLYLRDAEINGCSIPVDFCSGTDVTNTVVEELSSHHMLSRCRPGSNLTLRLPVKETPEYIPGINDWTCTTMNTTNTAEVNGFALQNDLNNCTTPVLYIPYGIYYLSGNITVSNSSLKMIKGFFPYLVGAPVTRICDSDGPLFLEDLVISPNHKVVQESDDPLVFRNIGVGPRIENSADASGDIFIENMGAQPRVNVGDGINVYIRQLNREKKALVNNGAVIWCLGDCIESMGDPDTQPWTTANGGISEIIGAQLDAQTDAAIAENAINYVYEIEGIESRFSVMGAGLFDTNLNCGWDLMIEDALGEDYLVNGYDADYDIRLYSGSHWGRMVVAPFIIDRRNLAFYPFHDGTNSTIDSLYHIPQAAASTITERSEFGFVNWTAPDNINGVSRNVNTMYLEDTTLTLDNYSTNYLDFTVTPRDGYLMDISGISFDYAGTNNNYNNSFTLRIYVTTGDATPQVLGDYAELSVPDDTLTDWRTHWIDLGGMSVLQDVTNSKTFRMYFTANVKHWRCIGLVDNVTVHGTCQKSLVNFDFESSLQPVFQDEDVQGLSAFSGRLRHQNDLGLGLQSGVARTLANQTPSTIENAVSDDKYLVFDLAPSARKSMSLRELSFDLSAAQLGTDGDLDCTVAVQASVKGFGGYQTLKEVSGTFSNMSDVQQVTVDLDYPAFQNIEDTISFRLYVADNQPYYTYRPAIDNLTVKGETE